jgi:hypothetical protein
MIPEESGFPQGYKIVDGLRGQAQKDPKLACRRPGFEKKMP